MFRPATCTFATCVALFSTTAHCQVYITQAKALAGDVTPGDAPGFPVTLSRAGSYKLIGNLTVGREFDGIGVEASDVTIDLNGYRIIAAKGRFNGIAAQADRLTVKNGTIEGFSGGAGIAALNGQYLMVKNLRVLNNNVGIANASGRFSHIQLSSATFNLSTGIECGFACQIDASIISRNNGYGIKISSGTILGNTISENQKEGIYNGDTNTIDTVGFGDNTLMNNNVLNSRFQTFGRVVGLFPNACSTTC